MATISITQSSVKSNQDAHSAQRTKRQTALQAISQGTQLPGIPSFSAIDNKRRWMLEHMAGAFRVFARKGFSEGMSGHISLRDPEHSDAFWTNPWVGLKPVDDEVLMFPKAGTAFCTDQSVRFDFAQSFRQTDRRQHLSSGKRRWFSDP